MRISVGTREAVTLFGLWVDGPDTVALPPDDQPPVRSAQTLCRSKWLPLTQEYSVPLWVHPRNP